MPIVLGDMDVLGDEDEGYAVVGRGPSRQLARRGGRVTVPTPRWMNATTSQGVSRPDEEMDVLPFDPLTIAAAASTGTLLSRPQRPFRGERLILGATNITAGTDASQTATINPAIYVGAVQVGASQGAIPFRAFQAEAFGVRMSWPPAGQGTDVKIFTVLTTVAPSGGVSCTATIFGRAMR